MALRFDEKGKYYTDYVSKNSIPVVMQTLTHHIRGYIYVQEDDRLSDELNRPEKFLPVTHAVVLDASGNKLSEAQFLAVNRSQIVWVYPEETPGAEETYAVEELLTGDLPVIDSEEIYIVPDASSVADDSLAPAEEVSAMGETLGIDAGNPIFADLLEDAVHADAVVAGENGVDETLPPGDSMPTIDETKEDSNA
jgi:hypothetical protein